MRRRIWQWLAAVNGQERFATARGRPLWRCARSRLNPPTMPWRHGPRVCLTRSSGLATSESRPCNAPVNFRDVVRQREGGSEKSLLIDPGVKVTRALPPNERADVVLKSFRAGDVFGHPGISMQGWGFENSATICSSVPVGSAFARALPGFFRVWIIRSLGVTIKSKKHLVWELTGLF